MFTGIIKDLGKIKKKTENTLNISADTELVGKLSIGESVAVDGICLTVVDKSENTFSTDFIPETKLKTTIKFLLENGIVNLELPVTSTTLLSGHIVQGHIDTIAQVTKTKKKENSMIFTFVIEDKWLKYLVSKGSVTINGVALTVIEVGVNNFTVGIIPHTLQNTNFSTLKLDDFVNIEIDILAKYIQKLK